ncbi:MAG: glycosyltransferase [Chitinophagaceae bacterium]|nr:glycosyltransferase [Chitinophagaceae bacterium]
MNRICSSLSNAGYNVVLVGRKNNASPELIKKNFVQHRLFCYFSKGKIFYLEYNIRLFFYLLFNKTDAIVAIDLDSILPCLWVSQLKKTKRVYDAHELFCDMEEIVRRPMIYKIWKKIESYAVSKFKFGYTIGEFYAKEFHNNYNSTFEIIRNATVFDEQNFQAKTGDYILYQGAVNEGRGFEKLIPAMKNVNAKLIVCGNGNFFEQANDLVLKYKLDNKIEFKGYVDPIKLKEFTKNAKIGIAIFDNVGKSNVLSLANRFFDYMHFGVPQLAMNYPEYQKINSEIEVALLLNELNEMELSNGLNLLINNYDYYQKLKMNCKEASKKYSWQEEEKKLISFYNTLFEN